MGLDIILYKVDSAGEEAKFIEEEELTVFQEYFKQDIKQEEVEYIDWELTFKKRDLDFEDYESMMETGNEFHFYSSDENKPSQKFLLEDCHVYNQMGNLLPVTEIGRQRKGMIDAFYLDYQDILTIFTKKEAESLLPYVVPFYQNSFKRDLVDAFIEGKTFISIER